MTVVIGSILASGAFQVNLMSAITNPTSTAPTSSFFFSTFTSAGIGIDSLQTGISLTAVAGALISSSLIPSDQIVGDTTTLTVTLTATHYIPVGGIIQVSFPMWNPSAPSAQILSYISGTPTCNTVAVLQSTLSCSFASQTLTVSNAIGSQITGGTQIAFSVSGFRNPLSTSAVSGFAITLFSDSSLAGQIDSGTETVTITQAATLTNAALTVDSSTSSAIAGIVEAVNNMRLQFSSPVPLNPTCSIQIFFPSQFSVAQITQILTFGMFGSQTSVTFTASTSTNSITFKQCTTYLANSSPADLTIISLQLPSYTKPTSSLSISISDIKNNIIASISSGITFTPTAGSISTVLVSAQNDVVLSTTGLEFQLVPSNDLDVNTKVVITLPSTYILASTCSLSSTSNINAAATCAIVSSSIVITSLLSTGAYLKSSAKQLVFTVSSITLPLTTTPTTGLNIVFSTQDPTDLNYYSIDTFTGVMPVTLSIGTLAATVTPSSLIAYAISSYTFVVTPQHYVPLNGYINITYPSNIQILDQSYSQSQCTGFTNFPSTPSCVINTNTNTISIQNGFRLGSTPTWGTHYTVTVPGIQNPINLQVSSSFQFSTYTSTGQQIDALTSGVTIQMLYSAYMQSMTITLGSYTNAAITNYTFQITSTVPVSSSNYVTIQFPPEITLPNAYTSLQCFSTDTLIFNSLQCTFLSTLSNGIRVQLGLQTSQINALETFHITVQNIQNPNTTAPSSQFNVAVTDQSYTIINQAQSNITVQTNTASTILQASITQSNAGAGQQSAYTFSITPLTNIQIGGGLLVIYPSQVTVTGAITATFDSTYTLQQPAITVTQSARQILITNMFQKIFTAGTAKLTFTLNGFTNPLTNAQTSSFIIRTFNQVGTNFYYINQVTDGLVLYSNCNYPCATCLAVSPSNCTSCYTTGSIPYLQGNTCVTACSTGRYYNTTLQSCQLCDPSCLACSGTSTTCTKCGLNGLLYLYNGVCQSSCPSGYVTDSTDNICAKCTNNCLTCQNTASTCTSCNTSSSAPLFYQTECLSSCPTSISVQSGEQCVSCDSSCNTCSGISSNCTSCLSNMRYDSIAHTCTQECAAGTQIYVQTSNQCVNCNSNCATCSGNTTLCTSCSSSLVLNTNNVCSASCSFTNQTAISGVCQDCQLPCLECKNSTSHCTKCQGAYLLYNTTCVQYCPPKYEANNSTMQCILVGLICPAGFTVNEAGDGCVPNDLQCQSGYVINQLKTACVPAPGSPVPFPFVFLSLCLSLIVLGSFIKDRFFTKPITCLISLLGSQEMLIYILMIGYTGYDQQWAAFALTIVATIMLVAANIIFFVIYKKEIMNDITYSKWARLFPRSQKILPLLALFVNFKTLKMVYSGFFGLESCLGQFDDPIGNFFKPMRMITFFSFIFVYIPIIIADIFILMKITWGYQLFVLAIESLLLICAIIALTVVEFRKPQKLILSGDEQYIRIKPRNLDNMSMVNNALVDVDESTLIRGKKGDDEYEIFLRKKALASILDQVGKNYLQAQKKGYDMGGRIDQIMTKFDEGKLKYRRAFSQEDIRDKQWHISDSEEESDDEEGQRRYSYPLSPRTRELAPDPQFSMTIKDIRKAAEDFNIDNVYADCKPPDRNKDPQRKKTISRRTQTYLRELLQVEGDNLQEEDLEVIMEDDAEIDIDYAQNLIEGVIDGLSESDSNVGGKKRRTKKKKGLNTKRQKEIPEFELADIMGEFEIDDLGNFIILRGEKGELLDKKERRVNRRGYRIDRFGNIINHQNQIIFKAVELDSDDEIPAPFGFEKRKKNLLNMPQEGEFKVEGNQEGKVIDDEDLIDAELKSMKKQKKKLKKNADGSIAEGDEYESSIDSLMAESPGKYQIDEGMQDQDYIIDQVTKKKVARKRQPQSKSPQRKGGNNSKSPDSARQGNNKSRDNMPPKRIKRENTKEIFPSLAIENQEQKKLFKIAESIGGLANQMAEDQMKKSVISNESLINTAANQDRLEKLKQEHFKEMYSDVQSQGRVQGPQYDQARKILADTGHAVARGQNTSDVKLPSKPNMDKIYGNLNDIVNYEEKMLIDQMRAGSPFGSQMNSRMGARPPPQGGNRRVRGLESIYMQKFDKKIATGGVKKQPKAKFRNTLNRFVDDPELLIDDGTDHFRQNEVSMMVADKLDKLQKQYMSNTATNRFMQAQQVNSSLAVNPQTSQLTGGRTISVADNNMGGSSLTIRKPGSVSNSIFNQDPSLEPVKKGNWVKRD